MFLSLLLFLKQAKYYINVCYSSLTTWPPPALEYKIHFFLWVHSSLTIYQGDGAQNQTKYICSSIPSLPQLPFCQEGMTTHEKPHFPPSVYPIINSCLQYFSFVRWPSAPLCHRHFLFLTNTYVEKPLFETV